MMGVRIVVDSAVEVAGVEIRTESVGGGRVL